MYKLRKYKKANKILLLILVTFIIIIPIGSILFKTLEHLSIYSYYFRPSNTGEQSIYTIDQLMARWFNAFSNWWGVYCVIYGIRFLTQLNSDTKKTTLHNWFLNPIFLAVHSAVIVLIFLPLIVIQLINGQGFLLENNWRQNVETAILHIILPIITFYFVRILIEQEELNFNFFAKKICWFVLILPISWLIFSYSRMAIYIYVHGFDKTETLLMWFEGYEVLNIFINPILASGLIFVGIILFLLLSVGIAKWISCYKNNFRQKRRKINI